MPADIHLLNQTKNLIQLATLKGVELPVTVSELDHIISSAATPQGKRALLVLIVELVVGRVMNYFRK